MEKYKHLALAIALCALPFFAYADDTTSYKTWAPWLDLEADPGVHRSIGLVDGFAPVLQNDTSLLFFNPRYRFDDLGSQEYNFGVGYRTLWQNQWVLGGYAYIDRDESQLGNYFSEGTFGVEALSTGWKARVNDYQPIGTHSYSGLNPNVVISDGTLQIDSGSERALRGNDAEIGYRVPIYDVESLKQLWVYGGGYVFNGADGIRTEAGPRARVEYEIGDVSIADRDLHIRLSGEIEHDDVRETQYFAGLRIGIPLGASGLKENTEKLSPLERHMADPVQRDIDIVTGTGTTAQAAINAYNNQIVASVATVNASTANVASSITAAGSNSVIVVDGSKGTINLPNDTSITMNNGQTLLGGGSSLPLRGATTGIQATYNAPGAEPMVTGDFPGNGGGGGAPIKGGLINLANDTVVKGLNVYNNTTSNFLLGNNFDIYGNNAVHFTVTQNILTTPQPPIEEFLPLSSAIYVEGNSTGTLSYNNIIPFNAYEEGQNGIISAATQPIFIIGNTITVPLAAIGIQNQIPSQNQAANGSIISGNTIIIGVSSSGIWDGSSSSIIKNNMIIGSGSGAIGIYLYSNSAETISNNTISLSGLYNTGLVISNSTNLSGTGNKFTGDTLCYRGGSNSGSVSFVVGGHCP